MTHITGNRDFMLLVLFMLISLGCWPHKRYWCIVAEWVEVLRGCNRNPDIRGLVTDTTGRIHFTMFIIFMQL